jgi:UDP-N-acetylglucosamine 3-dehydrogenase
MKKVMKVGVIGVGSMGCNHVRVYRELGADLVGVADINRKSARDIADKYGTTAYNNYEQLLDRELDAISIVVPTVMHHEIALKVLERKINVLVEKPIADTADNSKEIISCAHSNQVVLMVGHIERFNPAVRKLKEIIDEGVLGNLITLSSRRVGPFVERVIDVGIIVDIGTHDIDIARYLVAAEPIDTYGILRGVKHRKGDCAFLILEFEQVTSSIELNWFTPHRVRSLVVTGSKGIAYADYAEQTVVIYNSGWKMEPKIIKEEPLKAELSHFLRCVETGEVPLVTGEDGLKTLEIALNVEKKNRAK